MQGRQTRRQSEGPLAAQSMGTGCLNLETQVGDEAAEQVHHQAVRLQEADTVRRPRKVHQPVSLDGPPGEPERTDWVSASARGRRSHVPKRSAGEAGLPGGAR